MTSKEEYKGHVRALLIIWIRMLEEALKRDEGDPETVVKVVKAMELEKEGKEVPEELLK